MLNRALDSFDKFGYVLTLHSEDPTNTPKATKAIVDQEDEGTFNISPVNKLPGSTIPPELNEQYHEDKPVDGENKSPAHKGEIKQPKCQDLVPMDQKTDSNVVVNEGKGETVSTTIKQYHPHEVEFADEKTVEEAKIKAVETEPVWGKSVEKQSTTKNPLEQNITEQPHTEAAAGEKPQASEITSQNGSEAHQHHEKHSISTEVVEKSPKELRISDEISQKGQQNEAEFDQERKAMEGTAK